MNPKRAFTRKPHRDNTLTSSTLTPGTLTSPKISPSRPWISRTLRLAGSFRRVHRFRRTSAAASILAASLALSGCEFSLETIAEPFGPSPDETLVSMAFSAEDEAAAFAESDPGFSELRAQQASELFGEIARICGHHSDGSAPATCAVDRTERSNYDGNHHIANTPDQALHQLVESLADAPQQSQALLIEHAVTVANSYPTTKMCSLPRLTPCVQTRLPCLDRGRTCQIGNTNWALLWKLPVPSPPARLRHTLSRRLHIPMRGWHFYGNSEGNSQSAP
ncbi:hypothetical protein [Corynebacterium propinquum]